MFLLNIKGAREKEWQLIKNELMKKNATLMYKNQRLMIDIAYLSKQNTNLKSYIDAYENNFIELNDSTRNLYQIAPLLSDGLPEKLAIESPEIRKIFREMLSEKKLWNQYRQEQYKNVLESTVEPKVIESQSLNLENENNRYYFDKLEGALNLHKRLIRDVRLFHDEIQFQKRKHQVNEEYELYDLKFQLAPFAFENALADALQQAMSAFSAGIYEKEAVEVLDRIGEGFTSPIQELYEERLEVDKYPTLIDYNYNLYALFGEKMMDYSDKLARQSMITLGPSVFGELDFFNRRLFDSLCDLYQVGQDEVIDPSHLDLDELERVLYFRY
jgi:hypothetical protein